MLPNSENSAKQRKTVSFQMACSQVAKTAQNSKLPNASEERYSILVSLTLSFYHGTERTLQWGTTR